MVYAKSARTTDERRWCGRFGKAAVVLLTALLLVGANPAVADEHESDRAAHPLRIIAYVVHPIGVILDWVIVRPLHWLGSHEPTATLFGHSDS